MMMSAPTSPSRGTLPTITFVPTRHARRKTEKTVLPEDYEPSKFSVICGRGKGSYQSDGNINFRALIKSNLDRYRDAPGRLEKSFIVSEVLNMIRESCPVGAFVKYEKGRWYDLDDTVCREKVGSLFRGKVVDWLLWAGTLSGHVLSIQLIIGSLCCTTSQISFTQNTNPVPKPNTQER